MIQEGRKLADMLRSLLRPSKHLQTRLGDAVRDGISLNFERQRAGDGQLWVRLAPGTVAERVRLGYPGERPILQRRGEYRRGFTDPRHHNHLVRLRLRPAGWDFEVGSDDIRVSTHEGGRGPLSKFKAAIPARPVLILSRQAERWIEEGFEEYLTLIEPGDPDGNLTGLLNARKQQRGGSP